MAVQLQPITLLSSNYKILTKMLTSWLLPALPSVRSLPSSALFGATPFQGGGGDPLVAEYLHQCRLSGFSLAWTFSMHMTGCVWCGWTAC
jgi:hypothetical protein